MAFGTNLCVAQPDLSVLTQTDERVAGLRFSVNGDKKTISGRLRNLPFTEVIEDAGPGIAKIDVQFNPGTDAGIAGAFLRIDLPGKDYAGGMAELIDPASPTDVRVALDAIKPDDQNQYLRATAKGAKFVSPRRRLEVAFSEPTEIIVKDDRRKGNTNIQVYLTVISGNAKEGQSAQKSFTLKASGEVDKTPIAIAIDTSRPGRPFVGIGGNFRLQNPTADPPIIQYNLQNLDVAWGRVAMPWREWHPDEKTDPIEAAKAGRLNQNVRKAMEMAQTLAQRKIPCIISIWFPPRWAIRLNRDQNMGDFGGPGAMRGRHLDPEKWDGICESIGAYMIYLKENYGAEPELFSFNESDMGIDVLQTAEEHCLQIKKLGAYFATKGLAAKMLLGDTGDAKPTNFIKPAMEDPEALKYIGAVSFHSWRGGDDKLLSTWGDAAKKLNIPLFVGEGGTDPSAHKYPALFQEPYFALDEINLYIRICALCQPKSILEWQLTSDYSILSGGGDRPLQPTQRFWNLKQLGSTPAGSVAMPVVYDRPGIACAAFGYVAKGIIAVHIVNDGATRPISLSGLPDSLKELRVYITDGQRGMKELDRIPLANGTAKFMLETASFTTLIGNR